MQTSLLPFLTLTPKTMSKYVSGTETLKGVGALTQGACSGTAVESRDRGLVSWFFRIIFEAEAGLVG